MGTRTIGFATVLAFLVSFPTTALAQQPTATRSSWDLAVTAGSFNGKSTQDPVPGYGDDPSTRVRSLRAGWHHAAEWRVSAGRYWTPHFKTEVEFGATGEGDRYVQRFATVRGSTSRYPYGSQEFVKLRQGSARVTWQFLDNQWIHPYLSAGVSFDEERTRTQVFQPMYYPDPRNPSTRVAVTPQPEGPRTAYRTGVVLGGGAKWYVSPRAFIKTGAQVGVSRRGQTMSFLAGMGFDF